MISSSSFYIIIVGSAILQGGLFGLSSLFPPEYIQSAMAGMVRECMNYNIPLLSDISSSCFRYTRLLVYYGQLIFNIWFNVGKVLCWCLSSK